jgi:hypothetical protein
VQDVTSIDVRTTHTHVGTQSSTLRKSFTVTDDAEILRAAVAFNSLQGTGPFGPISCPAQRDMYTERVVFHTRTGDVVATSGDSCVDVLAVSRDGQTVAPELTDPDTLFTVLGIAR